MSILRNASQTNRAAIRAAERRRAQIPTYHLKQPWKEKVARKKEATNEPRLAAE